MVARLPVGRKTIELLENPNFEEWDDEELIRGQQRDKRGRFNGRLPRVIPLALLQELHKRNASKAIHKLEQTLLPAVEYLSGVADGSVEDPDPNRIRVCETLIDRILGKQQDRIVVVSQNETQYEKAGVQKAVVIRDVPEDGIIDVHSEDVDPYA